MRKYQNRREAGSILAKTLLKYKNHPDVIVLALPRGGVPVAFEIATILNVPLDVYVVRKLGVPSHPELAMGAIAMGGSCFLNEVIIKDCRVTKADIHSVIRREEQELARRIAKYRKKKSMLNLEGKIVILVDDGIATGATLRVAIQSLKQFSLKKLVIAVPVADSSICKELEEWVDEFYCPLRPDNLYAVGAWYDDFSQTEDEEVSILLDETKPL